MDRQKDKQTHYDANHLTWVISSNSSCVQQCSK